MKLTAGSTAVITGAGSGIGRGIAESLAARGLNVVVADIDSAAAQETLDALMATGATAIAVTTDVADPLSVEALADAAYERFGSVEVLCNNAGVLLFRRLVRATRADWEWVLSVNLWGVINGVQAFLPRMLAGGRPAHIVNTASVSGLAIQEGLPIGIYNTSKFAVVGMSEALADELRATNIGVSILCPGDVRTRITDAGRNRQEAFGGPFYASANVATAMETGMDPRAVGELVGAGIESGELYIHTHPEDLAPVADRHRRIEVGFNRPH